VLDTVVNVKLYCLFTDSVWCDSKYSD